MRDVAPIEEDAVENMLNVAPIEADTVADVEDVQGGTSVNPDAQYHVGTLVSIFSNDASYEDVLCCKKFRLLQSSKAPKVSALELRKVTKETILPDLHLP
ncbi:hypothetical protein DVH05_021891 [Phytophthora capsici]|nr:hypothetical protein DVH05_021891 [Phytophthora capsici]